MRVYPVRNTVTSLVAAVALLAAPLHTAWAGPAKEDAAKAPKDAPAKKKAAPKEDAADAEGPADAEETEPAEGEEAAPAEGDETEPAEGEEAEPAEGEEAEPAEGEETEPAEGEEPVEGEEGEEAEAEPEAEPEEEAAPEPAPQPEPPPPEPVAEPDPESDRPDEPRVGGKPRTGKGLMIAGGAVLGAGIASTITFSMITVGCDIDGPLNCKYEDQDQFLIPLGAATILLGTILLSVGVGYHMQYKRWQKWEPGQDDNKRARGRRRASIGLPMPAVTKNGAGLGWTGRF